jgi:shikimate dehydrogenase
MGFSRVWVAGRSVEKVEKLTLDLGGEVTELDKASEPARRAEIIINTTSVSDPEESPEMADRVADLEASQCRLVVDINYNRRRNFWADLARAKGLPFMDGLAMLAHQARLSFNLWTGVEAPVEEFLSGLKVDS